jgi:hypothetical protein
VLKGNKMSDTNEQEVVTNEIDEAQKKADADMISKLVEERIASDLKPIKEKLDAAYALRDAAMAKAAEYEKKERDAELQRLKEEGKHKEAFEIQLAEKEAKLAALEKANRELSRDVSVKDALKSFNFRSDNASDMAYREIVQQLVQDDKGIWVHRSGVSIQDYVSNFASDENNAFLFKVKANSGGGGGPTSTTGDQSTSKSLFTMPVAEVLKLAAEGKLPARGKY